MQPVRLDENTRRPLWELANRIAGSSKKIGGKMQTTVAILKDPVEIKPHEMGRSLTDLLDLLEKEKHMIPAEDTWCLIRLFNSLAKACGLRYEIETVCGDLKVYTENGFYGTIDEVRKNIATLAVPNGKYQRGDQVWWINGEDIRTGNILEIASPMAFEGAASASIQEIDEDGHITDRTVDIRLEDCQPSKKDCFKILNRQSMSNKRRYLNSIRTTEDLIRFLYSHDLTSENRDYDAQAAAIEKTKELFGINLEN